MTQNIPRRRLMAGSIGMFGEIYDFAVFGFSAPILSALFFPDVDPAAALLRMFAVYAVAFFARPLGGLVFGVMIDRVGRIKTLSTTIWLMAIGTALIGFLPTYASIGLAAPVLLVACRVLQGLSMGGETTGSTTYILESVSPTDRGRAIGWIWFYGFVPNAFTAVLLFAVRAGVGEAAYAEWLWRVPFIAGALIGIVGVWLRLGLEESEEFKQVARKAGIGNPLLATARSGMRSMLHVIFLQLIVAVGAYIFLGFMYSFLVREGGMSPLAALLTDAAAIMVMAVFMPISGILSDRFGRKPILSIGAICVAATAYPALYFAASGHVLPALLGQAVMAAAVGLYSGTAFTAMPELFPTAYRGTGYTISYQLSVALFGGVTPFMATWLVSIFQTPLAAGYYAAGAGLAGLLLVQFVPESRGVTLRMSVDSDSSHPTYKAAGL